MKKKILSIQSLTLLVVLLAAAACKKDTKVKVVRVERSPVDSRISTTSSGTVKAKQDAMLSFGVSGRVAAVNARVGEIVQAGTILAELENQDLRNIERDAARELRRTKTLFAQGLVSKVAHEEALRSHQIASANLTRSIIIAPFSGLVTDLNLAIGELAQMGTAKPLIKLVDMEDRLVKGEIDESDLPKVKAGQKANVKIPAVRPEPFEAEVTQVIPYVNHSREQDRTCAIELRITEQGEIPVGASAEIEIITAQKDDVVSLPSKLVMKQGEQRYVYRATNGVAKRAVLRTGLSNYERTEIVEGLDVGDTVIISAGELKEGAKITTEVVPWPSSN